MRLSSPVSHRRIGDVVYAAIRSAIIGGKLARGAHLVVDDLATELRVSRTPVKEALAKLEREGFVHTIPHHGAYVRTIGKRDIEEIYFLREVIEGLSARLAAKSASAALCSRLRELTQQAQKVLAAGAFDEYAELDVAFHREIRKASENARLNVFMENLEGQVRILIPTSSALSGRRRLSIPEHRRILTALESHDAIAAERAMREHVANARAALVSFLSSVPEQAMTDGGGAAPVATDGSRRAQSSTRQRIGSTGVRLAVLRRRPQ